ncbi:MAG: hypothetical protein L0154_22960, partial [Chloroflexi bacterium]|nr:hypothetical protein [Chloroflexota bacterium]
MSNLDQLEIQTIHGIGRVFEAEFHPEDETVALLAPGNLSIYSLPDSGLIKRVPDVGRDIVIVGGQLDFNGDTLSVATNRSSVLRNPATNDSVEFTVPAELHGVPTNVIGVADDTVILAGTDENQFVFWGFDLESGEVLWETTTSIEEFDIWRISDSYLYFTTGSVPQIVAERMPEFYRRIDLSDGTVDDLQFPPINTDYDRVADVITSNDDRWEAYLTESYITPATEDGPEVARNITILDAKTGEQVLFVANASLNVLAGESGFLITTFDDSFTERTLHYWNNRDMVWEQPIEEAYGLPIALGKSYYLTATTLAAMLFDLATGDFVQRLDGLLGYVNDVVFAPDNSVTYATDTGDIVQLAQDGSVRHIIETGKLWEGMFYSADTLVTYGPGVHFYENGELVYQFDAEYTHYDLTGETIVYMADSRSPIIVQPLEPGVKSDHFIEHDEPVTALALANGYVYGAVVGGVLQWDIETGELLRRLEGGGFLSATDLVVNDNILVSMLARPRVYDLNEGEVILEGRSWTYAAAIPFLYNEMFVWGNRFFNPRTGDLLYTLYVKLKSNVSIPLKRLNINAKACVQDAFE